MTRNLHNNGVLLKQLLPYINKYRDGTFLFVVPSYFFASSRQENRIWEDIAACSSLGIGCVVFIDFDWQLDSNAEITSAEVMNNLPKIAAMEMQARYGLSQGFHGYNQMVNILSGSWLLAQPKGVLKGNDMQSHGKLRSVATHNITEQLSQGSILILSNIAPDKNGRVYALNGQETVAAIATSLSLDKVILYVDNLPDQYRQVAVELSEAKQLIAETKSPKVKSTKNAKNAGATQTSGASRFIKCVSAASSYCEKGIKRAHILPGYEDGALFQEILTAEGYGFMVNIDNYEQLSIADLIDVQSIKELIAPWEKKEVLRPRTTEDLQRVISNFCVIKQDNNIIGCAALSPISGKKGYAELECVVVRDSHKGQGYGKRLLQSMEKIAIKKGLSNLAVFTTQTSTWFEEAGYKPAKVSLPVPDYCKSRNSKCLIKKLQTKKLKTK